MLFDCLNCTYADAFPADDSATHLRDTPDYQKREAEISTLKTSQTAASILQEERDELQDQLQQAKHEIKMLRSERKLQRLEIDKLRNERKQVQNALDDRNVFDW